jgi:hypothetical protein
VGTFSRSPVSAAFAYSPSQRQPTLASVSKEGHVDLIAFKEPSQSSWTTSNEICKSVGRHIGHFARARWNDADLDNDELAEIDENTIDRDMACVMRDRVQAGYSVDVGFDLLRWFQSN